MIQCVHQLIGDALPIDYAMDALTPLTASNA
jgi:hypothetical protein